MRSLNLQNMLSSGVGQALQNGLTVQWVYAGGATTGAPVTIWSENTGDANNNITVKYNGSNAWIDKKIAGVSRMVAMTIALSAGTYPVKIILNSDNTMQLIVNGVAASTGLGAELITVAADREFSSDTAYWTKGALWSISTGAARSTGGSATLLSRAGLCTGGRAYQLAFDIVTLGTASLQGCNIGSAGIHYFTTTGTGIARSSIAQFSSIAFYSGTNAASTFDVDNVSLKQINNNTDTTAIPWATVL